MLSVFDLYDLHAVLINIRNSPSSSDNEAVVCQILHALNEVRFTELNQIRSSLSELDLQSKLEYSFVYTKNVYPYVPFYLKDTTSYQLLLDAFQHLLNVIQSACYEQTEELADALHNLPLWLINCPKHSHFWSLNIVPYQKKWEKTFLKKYKNML